jgi:hypothetical protein
MLVFTDQRILVFEWIGFYGSKSRLARELPKIATPVGNFRGIWSRFTWSRFNELDEPAFIYNH